MWMDVVAWTGAKSRKVESWKTSSSPGGSPRLGVGRPGVGRRFGSLENGSRGGNGLSLASEHHQSSRREMIATVNH